MNTKLVALFLACVLSLTTTAFAQSKTTDNEIVKTETLGSQCRDEIRSEEMESPSVGVMANGIVCLGYIRGFWDSTSAQIALATSDNATVCMPAEISVGQLVRIYVKYIDAHPDKMDLPATSTLVQAIMTGFTCAKPSGGETEQPGQPKRDPNSAIKSLAEPRAILKIA